jgi:hypothetical protein
MTLELVTPWTPPTTPRPRTTPGGAFAQLADQRGTAPRRFVRGNF